MTHSSIQRRRFLQLSAAGIAAGMVGHSDRVIAGDSASLRIDQPFDGAVLNHRHGKAVDGGLQIEVAGEAPQGQRVTVNGVEARRQGTRFTADIVLRDKETKIVAAANGASGRQESCARVVWDRHSFPRYRVTIDDNGFFLRDIAEKNCRSLFDCHYLKGLRELNKKYGMKVSLNIFYLTGEFKLSQFPDRYRSEWQDNADWLRLAFHAYTEHPGRPYQNAAPEKLIADLDLVNAEILRFAGQQAFSPPTVIHFCMVQPSAFKPLYERGVRALSGYFVGANGKYDINYNLDAVRSQYLSCHDAWKDFDSGIVFSHVDIVVNSTPLAKIIPTLQPRIEDPNQAEIVDILTHEQYFWPFYHNYIPDHFQRLETAVRWATERGHKPVFLHEGFLGAPG